MRADASCNPPELIQHTKKIVDEYGKLGLRTLLLSYRVCAVSSRLYCTSVSTRSTLQYFLCSAFSAHRFDSIRCDPIRIRIHNERK